MSDLRWYQLLTPALVSSGATCIDTDGFAVTCEVHGTKLYFGPPREDKYRPEISPLPITVPRKNWAYLEEWALIDEHQKEMPNRLTIKSIDPGTLEAWALWLDWERSLCNQIVSLVDDISQKAAVILRDFAVKFKGQLIALSSSQRPGGPILVVGLSSPLGTQLLRFDGAWHLDAEGLITLLASSATPGEDLVDLLFLALKLPLARGAMAIRGEPVPSNWGEFPIGRKKKEGEE